MIYDWTSHIMEQHNTQNQQTLTSTSEQSKTNKSWHYRGQRHKNSKQLLSILLSVRERKTLLVVAGVWTLLGTNRLQMFANIPLSLEQQCVVFASRLTRYEQSGIQTEMMKRTYFEFVHAHYVCSRINKQTNKHEQVNDKQIGSSTLREYKLKIFFDKPTRHAHSWSKWRPQVFVWGCSFVFVDACSCTTV